MHHPLSQYRAVARSSNPKENQNDPPHQSEQEPNFCRALGRRLFQLVRLPHRLLQQELRSVAADHNAIVSTDERATAGIANAQARADAANQHALAAGAAAGQASATAQQAVNHVDSLAGVIANLDQYRPLQDVTVTFKFDKATLTPQDKQQLDALAANLTNTRGYILQLTGGTDTVGNAQYNYQLSQRRADAVVQYLASRYNVPPHKFYLVGIGKDQQIAPDNTAAGRAKNRRVEVQLLSNMQPSAGADGTPGPQSALR